MEHSYLSNYVVRSPLFSFEGFIEISSNEEITDSNYFKIINNSIFREALFLASPVLLKRATKWMRKEIEDKNEIQRIRHSILKYYSRMCFRCTPFGLFAGVSVGSFSNEHSSVSLQALDKQKKATRLDMFYLSELASNLAVDPKVKKHLDYTPNPSLYKVGSKFRYVEYRIENKRRKTEIVSIDNTDYLNDILNAANEGLNYLELIDVLVTNEISWEESKDFIDELVKSQILLSELEPYVCGPDFLEQIIEILKRVPEKYFKLEILIQIKIRLENLDKNLGNDVGDYSRIIELIDKLGVDYEINILFQTDLLLTTSRNNLSFQTAEDILEAFDLLEKLTPFYKDDTMSKFKESFTERYENQSIEIGIALDTDLGLGYGRINQIKDSNPLIDDLVLLDKNSETRYVEFRLTPLHMLLEKERHNKTHSIRLEDINIQSVFNRDAEDLSKSMTGTFEVIDVEGEEYIKFSGAGGSSATSLHGRFCHLSKDIYEICKKIIRKENEILEESYGGTAVYAEIAHLPKSRMGNVINRPVLRDYEIPYLANSILPREKQIRLKDLLLKINSKGELELISRRLKKRIIPRLATAHNYRMSDSQPIYTFLGELQSQSSRNGIGIDYAQISKESKFLPRLVYKKILLKEASWNFDIDDIDNLIKCTVNPDQLMKNIKTFKRKWNLPEFVMLIDGDNELLIRLTCIDSILMWLSTVKARRKFTVREYFFPRKIVLNKEGQNMAHEFIISFIQKATE